MTGEYPPTPELPPIQQSHEAASQLLSGLRNSSEQLEAYEAWSNRIDTRMGRIHSDTYRSPTPIGSIIATMPRTYVTKLAHVGSYLDIANPEAQWLVAQHLHGGDLSQPAKELDKSLQKLKSSPIKGLPPIDRLWHAGEAASQRVEVPLRKIAELKSTVAIDKAPGNSVKAFHEAVNELANQSPTKSEYDILSGALFHHLAVFLDRPEVNEGFKRVILDTTSPKKNLDGMNLAIIALEYDNRFPDAQEIIDLANKFEGEYRDSHENKNIPSLLQLIKSFRVIQTEKELVVSANEKFAHGETSLINQHVIRMLKATPNTIDDLYRTLDSQGNDTSQAESTTALINQSLAVITTIKESAKRILGTNIQSLAPPELQEFLKTSDTPTPLLDLLQAAEIHSQPNAEINSDALNTAIDAIREKYTLSAKKLRQSALYQQVNDNLRNGIGPSKKHSLESKLAIETSKFLICIEKRLAQEPAALFQELDEDALTEKESLDQLSSSRNRYSTANQPVLASRIQWLQEYAPILISPNFPPSIQKIGHEFLKHEEAKRQKASESDS